MTRFWASFVDASGEAPGGVAGDVGALDVDEPVVQVQAARAVAGGVVADGALAEGEPGVLVVDVDAAAVGLDGPVGGDAGVGEGDRAVGVESAALAARLVPGDAALLERRGGSGRYVDAAGVGRAPVRPYAHVGGLQGAAAADGDAAAVAGGAAAGDGHARQGEPAAGGDFEDAEQRGCGVALDDGAAAHDGHVPGDRREARFAGRCGRQGVDAPVGQAQDGAVRGGVGRGDGGDQCGGVARDAHLVAVFGVRRRRDGRSQHRRRQKADDRGGRGEPLPVGHASPSSGIRRAAPAGRSSPGAKRIRPEESTGHTR